MFNKIGYEYNFNLGVDDKVMAVDICNGIGLGAKLEWALEIMAFCDENNFIPQFKFSYPNEDDTSDYFNIFFHVKTFSNRVNYTRYIQIYDIGHLGFKKSYDQVLNMELGPYLVNKYIQINKNVINEVDKFCAEKFKNKKVLGVHFRGTDKSEEAPPVSYERVERNINFYLEKYPETNCIFVSSDDAHFIKYIENCSIKAPIVYRNDCYRATDDNPVHASYSDNNKVDVNRDAIVNCLLLSRCSALMKTASILSAWSMLFNPKLPLVMLNAPFASNNYFPERELLQNVLYEAID